MSLKVTLHAYCGMSIPLGDGLTPEQARDVVRRRLRIARLRGCPVVRLARGEWEICTPDDAFMVSDGEGVLKVRRDRRGGR